MPTIRPQPLRGPCWLPTPGPVARGGVWNLARIYTFAAGQSYYVTLTATRTSGQSHTLGRVIQVTAGTDVSCTMVLIVPDEE